MENRNFARLKELYHPVFLKDPIDSQIAEAMRNAEYHHLNSSVRDRITELLSEYGWFRFTKRKAYQEMSSISFSYLYTILIIWKTIKTEPHFSAVIGIAAAVFTVMKEPVILNHSI